MNSWPSLPLIGRVIGEENHMNFHVFLAEKGKTGRKKEDIFICFCLSTYFLYLSLKWERRWVWSMRRTMSKIFLIPKISRKVFLQTVRFSCVWASVHIHFYKRTVKGENPGAGRKFSVSLCIGIWPKLKMQFDIFKIHLDTWMEALQTKKILHMNP